MGERRIKHVGKRVGMRCEYKCVERGWHVGKGVLTYMWVWRGGGLGVCVCECGKEWVGLSMYIRKGWHVFKKGSS